MAGHVELVAVWRGRRGYFCSLQFIRLPVRDQGALVPNNPISGLRSHDFSSELKPQNAPITGRVTFRLTRRPNASRRITCWPLGGRGAKAESRAPMLPRRRRRFFTLSTRWPWQRPRKRRSKLDVRSGLIEGHKARVGRRPSWSHFDRRTSASFGRFPDVCGRKGSVAFNESFDRSKLDISLDGDLQPLPPDPELKDDEFMVLRDELEAEADA
ncbi:UNVERIFIED_CONTAM: hypothetical protein Sindi_0519900 [Sesamum indicum]